MADYTKEISSEFCYKPVRLFHKMVDFEVPFFKIRNAINSLISLVDLRTWDIFTHHFHHIWPKKSMLVHNAELLIGIVSMSCMQ